jgi:hypothetical protein
VAGRQKGGGVVARATTDERAQPGSRRAFTTVATRAHSRGGKVGEHVVVAATQTASARRHQIVVVSINVNVINVGIVNNAAINKTWHTNNLVVPLVVNCIESHSTAIHISTTTSRRKSASVAIHAITVLVLLVVVGVVVDVVVCLAKDVAAALAQRTIARLFRGDAEQQ